MYSDSGSIPGVPYEQSLHIITGCEHRVFTHTGISYVQIQVQLLVINRNHVFTFRFALESCVQIQVQLLGVEVV